MNLVAVGLSHKSAPVEIRERLSVTASALSAALEQVRAFADEGVLVCTCNRVELYAHKHGTRIDADTVRRFFASLSGLPEDDLSKSLYEFRDKEAVRHLFEVAAGMDSMVPGETQVLAQVKEAYMRSTAEGMTGPCLNPLFQAALREAKRIHTCTQVGRRKVSVGSVAAEMAEKVLGRLTDKVVLVLGAGKMGELTLRHLASKGARIIVANRTRDKAAELAQKFGGTSVTFDALEEHLFSADIVVASTAAPHFLIHAQNLKPVMERRKHKALCFIDIAVPRNVDPDVKRIRNVHLYDIDDLQKVVGKNLSRREGEMRQCRRLVDRAAERYWREAGRTRAAPVIRELTGRFRKIRQDELEKARAKLSRATEIQMREVERLTERLVNRLLHELLRGIKSGGEWKPLV
jgi:glutamyl-tRNA reductase